MKGGPLAARWLLGNRLLELETWAEITSGARIPDPSPVHAVAPGRSSGQGPLTFSPVTLQASTWHPGSRWAQEPFTETGRWWTVASEKSGLILTWPLTCCVTLGSNSTFLGYGDFAQLTCAHLVGKLWALCAQSYWPHTTPQEVGAVVIPNIQIRKLRLRNHLLWVTQLVLGLS